MEKQQQAQALQRYLNQADQLDQWLQSTRGNITSSSQDSDMEEQLKDCQVRAPPTADHQKCVLCLLFTG